MRALTPSPTPTPTPNQLRHRPVPDVATTLWCRAAEGGREGGAHEGRPRMRTSSAEGGREGGGDQGVGMRHTVVLK